MTSTKPHYTLALGLITYPVQFLQSLHVPFNSQSIHTCTSQWISAHAHNLPDRVSSNGLDRRLACMLQHMKSSLGKVTVHNH